MPGFKEFAIEWGGNRQTNNKTPEIEINLFNKYLLIILYLPANVLSAREIAINYKQTSDKHLQPLRAYIIMEGEE